MLDYEYDDLSTPTVIRLLHLGPRNMSEDGELRGEIFEYPIQSYDDRSHPYEALSYVWGSGERLHKLVLNGKSLSITQALHVALLRLRDQYCDRILWIDAVCIDQSNDREKEIQLPLMLEIYAKARCVLVWLGDAADQSDDAMKFLCRSAGSLTAPVWEKKLRSPVIHLLNRPWFSRIWILQEVGAARQISVVCGLIELSGHAFAAGVDHLLLAGHAAAKKRNKSSLSSQVGTDIKQDKLFVPEDLAKIDNAAIQVSRLIQGANYQRSYGRAQKGTHTFSELCTRFLSHKATIRHDKVYALVGLCSEEHVRLDLWPNYGLQWSILMRELIKHILGDEVSVSAWNDREIAVIRGTGYVVAIVQFVKKNANNDIIEAHSMVHGRESYGETPRLIWTLLSSRETIQKGDIVCLLSGSTSLTVIRYESDNLKIVAIAISPEPTLRRYDKKQTPATHISASMLSERGHPKRHFTLIWDSEAAQTIFTQNQLHALCAYIDHPKNAASVNERHIKFALRAWHMSLILRDTRISDPIPEGMSKVPEPMEAATIKCAQQRRRIAERYFEKVISNHHRHFEDCTCHLIPLWYAASTGNVSTMATIIGTFGSATINEIAGYANDNSFKRLTALGAAISNNHAAVVKFILDCEGVDVNGVVDTRKSRTGLELAAIRGHGDVARVLLDSAAIDVNRASISNWTPLMRAASAGHSSIVKLLLLRTDINVNVVDTAHQRSALMWAAHEGHIEVVSLLLSRTEIEQGQDRSPWGVADMSLRDKQNKLAYTLSIKRGHWAVAKRLLGADKNYTVISYIFGVIILPAQVIILPAQIIILPAQVKAGLTSPQGSSDLVVYRRFVESCIFN